MKWNEYVKENIIISIIWNLPVFGLSFTTLCVFGKTLPIYFIIGTSFIIFFIAVLASLKFWYLEDKIKSLEQKFDEKFGETK